MSKSNNVKEFNLAVMDILNIALRTDARNKHVKNLQSDVKIALSFNRSVVYDSAKYYKSIWCEQLLNFDENFFLKEIDPRIYGATPETLELIFNLKLLWMRIPPEHKEEIKLNLIKIVGLLPDANNIKIIDGLN